MRLLPRAMLAWARKRASKPDIYSSIASDSVLLMVVTTLSHACILAQVIILTRSLGPEGYGIFAFALTLQSYLFLLSCVGVRPVVVREAIQHPYDLDHILTLHLVFTSSASGLLSLLVLVASVFASFPLQERVLLGLLAIGNIPAAINLVPLFDAHHRQPRSAAITLVSEAAALLLLTWLYHSNSVGLVTAGTVFSGKWATNAGLHCWDYHCRVRPIRLAFGVSYLHRIARSSGPLILSALAATTPFSAGVFIVRLLCDDTRVAVLGLGQQAAAAYLLLTAAAIRIAQPYLAGPRGGDGKFLRRLTILYGFIFGVLLLAFLGGAFVIVRWILDARYQEALIPMILLLTAAFVYSHAAFGGAYLIVQRKEIVVLVAHGCAAVFYLLACWWVVRLAGVTGAAFMSVAAEAVVILIITTCLLARSSESFRLPLSVWRIPSAISHPSATVAPSGTIEPDS